MFLSIHIATAEISATTCIFTVIGIAIAATGLYMRWLSARSGFHIFGEPTKTKAGYLHVAIEIDPATWPLRFKKVSCNARAIAESPFIMMMSYSYSSKTLNHNEGEFHVPADFPDGFSSALSLDITVPPARLAKKKVIVEFLIAPDKSQKTLRISFHKLASQWSWINNVSARMHSITLAID